MAEFESEFKFARLLSKLKFEKESKSNRSSFSKNFSFAKDAMALSLS